MKFFSRPLFSDFSPHIAWSDVFHSLHFFMPWKWPSWSEGDSSTKVEAWLSSYLGVDKVYVVDSGRSALFLALQACGVDRGDEVILPGYTCVVVANAVRWLGAKPVFVDITADFNIDVDHIEKHISQKTRAIIAQHTFGRPSYIDHISALGKKHNIFVIEDCAHSIGGEFEGRKLGTIGDVAIMSFGSDKIVGCIRGGAIVSSNTKILKRLDELTGRMFHMHRLEIMRHLLYYPFFAIGKAFYNIGFGKLLLYVGRKMGLLADIMSAAEKQGRRPIHVPAKMPNALASILLRKLHALESNIDHRKKIWQIYAETLSQFRFQEVGEGVPLYFTFLYEDPFSIQKFLRKKGIYLTMYWTGAPIVPKKIPQEVAEYKIGLCPTAEDLTKQVVSLPTHTQISEKSARRIVRMILLCTR